MSKRLYTAASYLIILQNLEKACLARQVRPLFMSLSVTFADFSSVILVTIVMFGALE